MNNLWLWAAATVGVATAGAIASYSFKKKQVVTKAIFVEPTCTYDNVNKITQTFATKLFTAIVNGNTLLVRELLSNNKINIATMQDEDGDTLVMKALKLGRNEIAIDLVLQILKEDSLHTLQTITNGQHETAFDIAKECCPQIAKLLEKVTYINDNDNSENAAGALIYDEDSNAILKKFALEEINNYHFSTNSQTVSAGNLKLMF